MDKLTRKESIAIATIHDAIREFRIKGRHVNVNMFDDEIIITVYADTKVESLKLKDILYFFKDEDDTIDVKQFPASEDLGAFYAVRLNKRMV